MNKKCINTLYDDILGITQLKNVRDARFNYWKIQYQTPKITFKSVGCESKENCKYYYGLVSNLIDNIEII